MKIKQMSFTKNEHWIGQNKIEIGSRSVHQYTCLRQKICQIFVQFELRRAPDSVICIFLKWDKRNLVIINDF